MAARLIGWSDGSRRKFGDPRPRVEQADVDRDIAAVKSKIGVPAYQVAYELGSGMTLDETVTFAVGEKSKE